MAQEGDLGISDAVTAALVECVQDVPDVPRALPAPPDLSPTERAAQATVEQTGADPPPEVARG